MEILSKITPAETLLITNGSSAKLKEMLKYTFMDLLLKKVIKIKEVENAEDGTSNTYVVAEKNFIKHKPKNHEITLLKPFQKDASIEILLEHFIKMAYQASRGGHYYRIAIKKSPAIHEYFKDGFFAKVFGSVSLNEQGIKLRKAINDYLETFDNEIDELLAKDKEKTLKRLMTLGGNMFLLKNLDLKEFKDIDKEFLRQKKKLSDDSEDSDDFDMMWFYMDFFDDDTKYDTYFESFDDAFDSADSSSGCSSGDSGDSGCSGCGGCGGD